MFHTHDDDFLFFSVLRPGFSQEDYTGNEGPDEISSLPSMPCTVIIGVFTETIENDLVLRLSPRTYSENIAANGPPPTAPRLDMEFNASSKNM